MNQCNLLQLKKKEKGRVVAFNGGQGLINKLNARNIRSGKELIKISDNFVGGPVTVQVDNAKIAIGQRMAAKIIVEVVV